jgi:Na+/H+-dicarboxylate symporter
MLLQYGSYVAEPLLCYILSVVGITLLKCSANIFKKLKKHEKRYFIHRYTSSEIVTVPNRVGKNPGFFFKNPASGFFFGGGFIEFFGFYWVFLIWCLWHDILLYIIVFKCSPWHVSELPLTTSPFRPIFKVQEVWDP